MLCAVGSFSTERLIWYRPPSHFGPKQAEKPSPNPPGPEKQIDDCHRLDHKHDVNEEQRCVQTQLRAPPHVGWPMTDIVDTPTRSRMMAGISGQGYTTRDHLAARTTCGRVLGFRLHDKRLPGKPDLVFPRFGAVCFAHGCFWHRHPQCRYATNPATRPEFWEAKFQANIAGDKRNRRFLIEAGWRVCRRLGMCTET